MIRTIDQGCSDYLIHNCNSGDWDVADEAFTAGAYFALENQWMRVCDAKMPKEGKLTLWRNKEGQMWLAAWFFGPGEGATSRAPHTGWRFPN